MDRQQFAQQLKARYPSYQKMDDNTLVDRIIQKNQLSTVVKDLYPQYTDVDDLTITKKVLPQIATPIKTTPTIPTDQQTKKEGVIDKLGKEFTGLGKSITSTALGIAEPIYNLPSDIAKLATGKELYKPLGETKFAQEEATAREGEKIGKDVGDIGQLAFGGVKGVEKATEKVALKEIGELSERTGIKEITAQPGKAKEFLNTLEDVKKPMTKAQIAERPDIELKTSKLTGESEALATKNDVEVAKSVEGIYNPKKSPQVNKDNINKAITETHTGITEKLSQDTSKLKVDNINTRLDNLKKSFAEGHSEEEIKQFDPVVNKLKQEIKLNSVNGEIGHDQILQSRINTDNYYKKYSPKIFSKDTPKATALRAGRDEANNIITEIHPEYKEAMKKESNMLQAYSNVHAKAITGKIEKTAIQKAASTIKKRAAEVVGAGAVGAGIVEGGKALLTNKKK